MPKTMTTMGEGQRDASNGGSRDEEQRRLVFAGLGELDVLTADDEEEISRFRAFAAEPVPRHRGVPWAWPRRRPALPI